jgi:hypothetical protein
MLFSRKFAATAAALATAAGVWLSAQTPQVFQFFVTATDAAGAQVTDLRPEDIVMSEDGVRQQIARVEARAVPMKLTITVDNGGDSGDAIEHYHAGLNGLVEALPRDVEITLIATAPQPRTVVKSTTDHARILRGIRTIAPERERPRFSDTLVEYSQRLQREAKDRLATQYVPVLLMVSTSSPETGTYQPKQIQEAVEFLVKRHAKVNVVILSTRQGDVKTATGLISSLQAVVGQPAVQATNGRFATLAVPRDLATLLPKWGRELATLQARQNSQFRVTVERSHGGDLKNPRIELARPGLTGTVSPDGFLP